MTQASPSSSPDRAPSFKTPLAISAAITLVILHELRWVLLPFVLAGLLAYLFHPLVNLISNRFGVTYLKSAVLIFSLLLSVVIVAGVVWAPILFAELKHLVTDSDQLVARFAHSLVDDRSVDIFGKSMDAKAIAETATESLRIWFGQSNHLTKLVAASFMLLFGGVLTLVLFLYLLAQGPQISRGILWLVPPNQRTRVTFVWARVEPQLWRYVIGVLVVVFYATLAAYVGLGLVLGLKHAFLLALLTGLLEMIPVVGPGASALIGALVAIGNAAGIGPVIGYAIYAIFLRLSIDQLLGPLVLGAAATLSPVIIIFGFLVGGALFGIPGVILSVPFALVIKTSVTVLRDEAQAEC